MEIASTSTSIDLQRCILWQYDRATNLLNIFSGMNRLVGTSTNDFWNGFLEDVLNADTATGEPPEGEESPFRGLDTLGRIIGVQRPENVSGEKASDGLYRRILKAHLYLSFADASAYSIGKYLVMLFGATREIDLGNANPAVGDSVVIGGITYTFISGNDKYGEDNEVKVGATAAYTAANLADVVNAVPDKCHEGQKANPNVSPGGASASGSVVTLQNEYWPADGESAAANVVVVDNADMTIDYRIAHGEHLDQEEKGFLSPYSTDGILNGGQIFGYTIRDERIVGYVDPNTGERVLNPAFDVLFPFPAGVRTHIATPHENLSPVGLNENEATGQNRANFVYDDSQPNGASYSSDGAS